MTEYYCHLCPDKECTRGGLGGRFMHKDHSPVLLYNSTPIEQCEIRNGVLREPALVKLISWILNFRKEDDGEA